MFVVNSITTESKADSQPDLIEVKRCDKFYVGLFFGCFYIVRQHFV